MMPFMPALSCRLQGRSSRDAAQLCEIPASVLRADGDADEQQGIKCAGRRAVDEVLDKRRADDAARRGEEAERDRGGPRSRPDRFGQEPSQRQADAAARNGHQDERATKRDRHERRDGDARQTMAPYQHGC